MPLAQPLATKEPYGCGIPLAGASRRVFRTQNRRRQQRRARVSPPYAKGVAFAPKPKLCVGRDALIAPRIPDAESMAPATAGSGEPALRRRGRCCAQFSILRRAGCSHPAANSGRRTDCARKGRCGHRPLRKLRSNVRKRECLPRRGENCQRIKNHCRPKRAAVPRLLRLTQPER